MSEGMNEYIYNSQMAKTLINNEKVSTIVWMFLPDAMNKTMV